MGEPRSSRIRVLEDLEAVSTMAAETVVEAIGTGARRRGRCVIALSGGSTPVPLYALLASPRYDPPVPWAAVHLVWGDERAVPPDHPDSNYRLVEQSGLLRRALGGVHRMAGELDPEVAATRYEQELCGLLGGPADALPRTLERVDLAILGLGEDGHTASLFPGSPVLEEERRLVRATEPHAGHRRLTMTLPLLEAAREVLFLVVGPAKAEPLARVVDPAGDAPAARVIRRASRVTILADRAAAARLG